MHHRLATITKGRALHGHRVEGAADLVDHEGGQRLTLDVFGQDEQRLAGLHDLLKHRKQLSDRGDLALVQQDVGVVEHGFHRLGVGHEVRRQVALVELHALGEVKLGAHGVGLLDGDHTVLADLVEGLGEEFTDPLVATGHGGHGGHVVLVVDIAGSL